MTREELKKKFSEADVTLLEDFEKFYVEREVEKYSDVEITPGKLLRGIDKVPGTVRWIK